MSRAVLVIDMQNDFIDGSLGTKEAVDIIPTVQKIVEDARENGDQVIFTRDTHFNDYLTNSLEGKKLPVEHCIRGTDGWNITDKLNTKDSIIIDKLTFGFNGWQLLLDNADEIAIIGLCTDICVISNALIIRALYPNKRIVVYEDATAAVTPDTKIAAITTMKMCQIDIENYN